jgi:hypothetical protein
MTAPNAPAATIAPEELAQIEQANASGRERRTPDVVIDGGRVTTR